MSSPEGLWSGNQVPRVRVAPRADLSFGDIAGEFAARWGLQADPWQQLVLDDWLSQTRPDVLGGRGLWCGLTCGLSVPRQNGKNAVLEMRELFGILRGEKILHTAHQVKALDVDTPILTERGWATMGDLVTGDRVWGPDGQLTNVIAHPIRQGRPCYRLTFDDGQTVVADEDHLWGVYRTTTYGKKVYEVVTTAHIAEAGTHMISITGKRRARFAVQITKPLELPESDLPVAPWVLGAWLGDGDSSGGRFTVGAGDLEFLLDSLIAHGVRIGTVSRDRRTGAYSVGTFGLKQQLRELGVLNNKHIPAQYLQGSVAQRKALLAGLMDTDGGMSGGRQAAITMKRAGLIDQILELVRSLGYKASRCSGDASCNGRPAGQYYRVQFYVDGASNPFAMPRKRDKVPAPNARPTRATRNSIVRTEAVESRRTRCITVDNESRLYVVGHGFIPTHNTAQKHFRRLKHFFGRRTNDPGAEFPELNAKVAELRNVNGQEAIMLDNGGSIEIVARSTGSGRGFTVDVLVMDEAQDMSDDDLEALMPTTSSAPLRNPQWIYTGTPPGPKVNGEVFARVRDSALAQDPHRMIWHEWSAVPDADLDDRAVWTAVNPGLVTGRLQWDVVEGERATYSDDGFARERLGVWADVGSARVIDERLWAACADAQSRPESRLVLGVDVDPERTTASVALAGLRSDGRVHVELYAQHAGVAWLANWIISRCRESPIATVVVDAGSPAGAIIDTLRRGRVRVAQFGSREMTAACGRFFDGVMSQDIVHTDQPQVNAALASARKRSVGPDGSWAWNRKNPESDITPLVAETLAAWGVGAANVRDKAASGRRRVVVMS